MKGDADHEIDVWTAAGGGACGAEFRDSTNYLVMADPWNGHLSTGLCSGNRQGDSIDAALGEIDLYLDFLARPSLSAGERSAVRQYIQRRRREAGAVDSTRAILKPLLASDRDADRETAILLLGYSGGDSVSVSLLLSNLPESPLLEARAVEALCRSAAMNWNLIREVAKLIDSPKVSEARIAISVMTNLSWMASPWRADIEARRSNPILVEVVDRALTRIQVPDSTQLSRLPGR